jgi:hypothetical protein
MHQVGALQKMVEWRQGEVNRRRKRAEWLANPLIGAIWRVNKAAFFVQNRIK